MSERQYWIEVEGFDGHMVLARSAGAARWKDFLAYEDAGFGRYGRDHCTQSERFKRFLARTVCHAHGLAPTPPEAEQ